MNAPPDIAALIARLRDPNAREWQWNSTLDDAADALEACARDAARWRYWRPRGINMPSTGEVVYGDELERLTDRGIAADAAIDRARGET